LGFADAAVGETMKFFRNASKQKDLPSAVIDWGDEETAPTGCDELLNMFYIELTLFLAAI
jgi:hypothetical protein